MQKTLLAASVLLLAGDLAAETKITVNALPPAVQTAAKTEAHGAEVIGASKEVEHGQTIYEVLTKQNGKSRDLSFDPSGKLLEVEQEVDLKDLPPAVQSALRTRTAGGTIRKIESVSSGGSVSYEASVVTKSGKHTEIAMNADGTPHNE